MLGYAGVTSLVSDPHATAEIAVDNGTNELTRRYLDPYGNDQGATGDWVGDHGFLFQIDDNSGWLVSEIPCSRARGLRRRLGEQHCWTLSRFSAARRPAALASGGRLRVVGREEGSRVLERVQHEEVREVLVIVGNPAVAVSR